MLKEARAIFAESNFVAQVLETDTRIAECHLIARRPEEALAVADGALAVEASRDGLSHARSALLRARGYALAQLGRWDEARRALEESLAAAREREADHEPLEEERQLLLERLGIVRAFSVPLAA
jgi:tetratricopeptide (TPR) repeat protein